MFKRSCVVVLPLCAAVLFGCQSKKEEPHGATEVVGQSWDLCTWLGPSTQRPGIFGSDLGFAVPLPSQSGAPELQQLLFGDTWAAAAQDCNYPVLKNDDFATRIPYALPPGLTPGAPAAASNACTTLQYTQEDASDPTSWRRIRLFPDAGERTDDRVLDTSTLRTPLTAFTDGTHTFVMYIRNEYARCQTNAECAAPLVCTQDPSYQGKPLGGCQPYVSLSSDAAPAFCRVNASDCPMPAACLPLDKGVCFAPTPFASQAATPTWNADDPRNGLASVIYIASQFWPDRPEDLATGFRFVTNKFANVTARTVKHFDPAQPENSDYSDGNETLLLWGRANFIGADGFQALPFLLYQPLAGLIDASGQIAWAPQYFAGYGADGAPAWSASEAEAQPIYGGGPGDTPEFDYVNQMSMVYVPTLQRWLMVYGGSTPATMDPRSLDRPAPTYAQSVPGAVYLRSAVHPFGRANSSAPAADGFSAARPLLIPKAMAKQLACDEGVQSSDQCTPGLHEQPGGLLDAIGNVFREVKPEDVASTSASCAAGGVALDAQYSVGNDASGHLYGAAVIDSWTQDVTAAVGSDEPTVEFYWNVSTWNPYQVLLMKTQLKAADLD